MNPNGRGPRGPRDMHSHVAGNGGGFSSGSLPPLVAAEQLENPAAGHGDVGTGNRYRFLSAVRAAVYAGPIGHAYVHGFAVFLPGNVGVIAGVKPRNFGYGSIGRSLGRNGNGDAVGKKQVAVTGWRCGDLRRRRYRHGKQHPYPYKQHCQILLPNLFAKSFCQILLHSFPSFLILPSALQNDIKTGNYSLFFIQNHYIESNPENQFWGT